MSTALVDVILYFRCISIVAMLIFPQRFRWTAFLLPQTCQELTYGTVWSVHTRYFLVVSWYFITVSLAWYYHIIRYTIWVSRWMISFVSFKLISILEAFSWSNRAGLWNVHTLGEFFKFYFTHVASLVV